MPRNVSVTDRPAAPPPPDSASRGRRDKTPSGWRRLLQRRGLPYLLLLPALALELLIHIIPMLVGIGMSFLDLTQFYIRNWTEAPFAGLDNFAVSIDLGDPVGQGLLHSFGVTAAFTALVIGGAWLFGMFAAVLLQRPFYGRGWLRTLFLVPYALPIYAAVITWSFMLQRDTGVVNHLLVEQFGLLDSRPFWLIGGNSFWSLVIVSLWRTWPFAFLVLMAGMQNIPQDLYESANIDGAGMWRQFKSITLPLLRPINQVLVIVLFLWTFNDFNVPYILFGQDAPDAADIISIHIYQNSFVSWNFGLGSAMSVLLLLLLLVLTTGYLRGTRRGHDV